MRKNTVFHVRLPNEMLADLRRVASLHAPRVTMQELVRHTLSEMIARQAQGNDCASGAGK